jgi:L-iditol 2-dehydrogenase
MKAAQLVAPRRVEIVKIEAPPAPAAGEVLVRMRAVGICGSDMHWYREGRIGEHAAQYPQILGHEPVAEIVEAGPGSNGLRAGDRVTIEPTVSCGHCEYCLLGQHNNCLEQYFMGGPQAPGLLREYAIVPVRNAIPVPAGLNDAQASLIEPLAVIMHMLQLAPFRAGWTAAVVGAGPIGMLAAAVLKQSGAGAVLATDCLPYRLPIARQMGADCAVAPEQFPEAVMDRTRGRGAQFVVDAGGGADAINLAMTVSAPGATVVIIAIPSDIRCSLAVHLALAKELRIIALKRSNHNSEAAISLLAAGRIPEALITHRFGLEQSETAFATLAAYSGGIVKALIDFA